MKSPKLDPRIVRLAIIIDGKVNWYEGLIIEIKGVKFSSAVMGQCDITILNLRRDVREYILRETNPLLGRGKRISVIAEVGRASYGTSTLYTGDVFRSEQTPKPNLGIRLSCIQGFNNKSKIVSRSGKEITALSSIAKWVAEDNGYNLSFEITDKNITRYSFTGSAQAALTQLAALAQSDVYVDNETLYIKESGKPANGTPVLVLDRDSGLITAGGTEYGAKVQMLYNPVARVGGRVDLTSEINPSLNGSYTIRKLPFHITSRGTPFYYVAEMDKRR
jgi:hypothetical protein